MPTLINNIDETESSLVYAAELSDLPINLGGTNNQPAFINLIEIFSYQFILDMVASRLRRDISLKLSQEYITRDSSWIKLAYESARIGDVHNEKIIIHYAETLCGGSKTILSDEDIYYIVSVMIFLNLNDYNIILSQEKEMNNSITRVDIDTVKKVSKFLAYYEEDGVLMNSKDLILFSQRILPEDYYALRNNNLIEQKNIRFLVEAGFNTREEILEMYNNLPSELLEEN
jgi:hypothetical protein